MIWLLTLAQPVAEVGADSTLEVVARTRSPLNIPRQGWQVRLRLDGDKRPTSAWESRPAL
jgi:hypothetical protein